MRRRRIVAVVAALTVAFLGWSSESFARCRVTLPGGQLPAGSHGVNYGNRTLAVRLWPHGKLVAGRLPGGGALGTINADGSIRAKIGWWRGIEGPLRITGKRLDAHAPSLTADIPDGYEPTGFQPTALTFPTTGCWAVRGHLGSARLRFVVLVSKRG
jgi:hypothetical protein